MPRQRPDTPADASHSPRSTDQGQAALSRADRSLVPAAWLALGITLWRLIYLRFFCTYALVEDEAQYWLWSRFLDWSYYSKGPGVAWAIGASTRVFGNAEWAVRLPTALMMGLGTLAIAALTRDLVAHAWSGRDSITNGTNSPWATPSSAAVFAVIAFALAPALQMVGILMTIDGSYVACWACAAWLFWQLIQRSSARPAPTLALAFALGLSIAIGFLFKYTMLLLVPGLIGFAWSERARLPRQRVLVWALAGLVALLGLAPVLLWNAQRGWPTLRHLLGHLGLRGGDIPVVAPRLGYVDSPERWSPWWTFELVAQQLGMIGPALVLAAIGGWGAWTASRQTRVHAARDADRPAHDPRWQAQKYLICCAIPIIVFYLSVALIAEPEGNWPMAAYVTLMPLAGWIAADVMAHRRVARAQGDLRPASTRTTRILWRATLMYGVFAAVLLHFAGPAATLTNTLASSSPVSALWRSITGRTLKPIVIGRLYGAKEMALHVDRLMRDLPLTAAGPAFVITQHYGRASQMAYYLSPLDDGSRRDVLCAMAFTGGRRSQFDLWDHTSLSRTDLIGRSAIILSNDKPETLAVWRTLFGSVEPIPGPTLPGGHAPRLDGEHKPDRVAFIGRGYRGPNAAHTTVDPFTPASR